MHKRERGEHGPKKSRNKGKKQEKMKIMITRDQSQKHNKNQKK
jgi:hypothetical protein